MIVVGLTGGIGSGKTTVANLFRQHGVPVYIADDEARILTDTSDTIKEGIIAAFGNDLYKNGQLDRKKLASIVFNAPDKLARLNEVVHPEVRAHFQSWLQKQTAPYVVYEAAILFETGAYKNFDYTILVTADQEERIRRLIIRDGGTREEVLARMNNQWSDEQKRALADLEIINMNLEEVKLQVWEIHKKFVEKG